MIDLFCLKLTHYWPHNRVLSRHLQVENFFWKKILISATPWRKGAGRISGNTSHSFQSNNDLGLISYGALDRACVSRLPLLPVVPHTKLKFFSLLPLSLCTDLFQRRTSKQQKETTCYPGLFSVFYIICLASGSFPVCTSWFISSWHTRYIATQWPACN